MAQVATSDVSGCWWRKSVASDRSIYGRRKWQRVAQMLTGEAICDE